MYQVKTLEFLQRRQHLLRNGTDVLQRQRLKLVLLEKVVQILLQHLEHQARVELVREALVRLDEVVRVGVLATQALQYADLDLTLTHIRRVVLEDLDGAYLVGAFLPALDHLAERAATEELEHLVGVVVG